MKKSKSKKVLKDAATSKYRAEEPLVGHSTEPKKLTVSTLAEQEESNYLYWLSLTPSQRIANATALIRKVYAYELSRPSKKKRIIFDKI